MIVRILKSRRGNRKVTEGGMMTEAGSESPENPSTTHIYGYLTNDKGAKALQWGRDHLFNERCRVNWIFPWKKTKS